MTGIRKGNRLAGFFLTVIAVWALIFQYPSYAAQRGSLNVKTEQAGMTIHIYRVAEKQAGIYVMNEAFQASGVDVKDGPSRDMALALAKFVKGQGTEAYRTGTGTGKHVFFQNLPEGETLYLVTGDTLVVGKKTYMPVPVLVEAGSAAAEVDMKCDVDEPEAPTDSTDPTKPTSPTGPEDPTSPTRHYDDSDDDDWDPTPDKKPRVTTAANETVTVTDAETQAETSVQESTAESETETSTETSTEHKKKIPQTGQLWWPVEILVCVGMILCLAGGIMKHRNDGEK